MQSEGFKGQGDFKSISVYSQYLSKIYGYLEYTGDKSVDAVRVAFRQENEKLRQTLEETQKREQALYEQLTSLLQSHKALIEAHVELSKTLDNITLVLNKTT